GDVLVRNSAAPGTEGVARTEARDAPAISDNEITPTWARRCVNVADQQDRISADRLLVAEAHRDTAGLARGRRLVPTVVDRDGHRDRTLLGHVQLVRWHAACRYGQCRQAVAQSVRPSGGG